MATNPSAENQPLVEAPKLVDQPPLLQQPATQQTATQQSTLVPSVEQPTNNLLGPSNFVIGSLLKSAPANGIPEDEDINCPTYDDEIIADQARANTEELSDITDEDDLRNVGKTAKHSFSTWYHQIQPLVRNKRVRCFSFTNLIMFLINVALLIALIVLIVYMASSLAETAKYRSYNKPCFYEWTAWSDCSKTCRGINDTDPPTRFRRIKIDTLVQSRGYFDTVAKCPENLFRLVDYAPCNTYLCPQKLSDFPHLNKIFYKDPSNISAGCYKIRNVPKKDMLIELDVFDLTISSACPTSHNESSSTSTAP
ncbi:hypothetical protein M3Y98_00579300 [Aphelenchoides besseyi]|nr:hypothetical protein M3Y98_00579300 [Aphelenchoides besseyi]KAI6193868.1 hypothetical protein M3Y96_01064400 [Aphelenchoides besseyi]